MRISRAVLVAASCLMLGSLPALAQSAEDVEKAPPVAAAKVKAKAKKKVDAAKTAGTITIVNARADVITSVGIATGEGKAVGGVKKPLAPGKKATVKISAKGCEFVISARFADGTDFDPAPVNLCVDKTIRFTDGEGGGAPANDPAPDDAQ